MNKICLVICYFGKFPDYFYLWKNSALANNTIDFLIFTDNKIKSEKNIKIVNCTLESIKKKFEDKLGFEIALHNPYKMCDFKTSYGFMFEDYLTNYDFWGYCDIDLVFGNIRKFITEKILKDNEVVLNLGHFTLFKNNEKLRRIFMMQGAIYDYKKVYTSNENYAFDEMSGLHLILKKNAINCYKKIPIADINRRYVSFMLEEGTNYKEQVFYYMNNGIFRDYKINNKIYTDELMYLHFQKRKLEIKISYDTTSYYICPDGFLEMSVPSDFSLNAYNEKIERKSKVKYLISKIREFKQKDLKAKIIWLKQKIYSNRRKK